MIRVIRSYLYVPANQAERLQRSIARGADAVIADLEDSVALNEKDVARVLAAQWLHDETLNPDIERWVRVNSGDRGIDDIAHVYGPGLTGVCLAKVTPWDARSPKRTTRGSRCSLRTLLPCTLTTTTPRRLSTGGRS